MSHLERVGVACARLPMKRAFTSARARATTRQVVILRIGDGERAGHGEAAPLPGFSAESFPEVLSALEVWASTAQGARPKLPQRLEEVEPWLATHGADVLAPSARFAVEVALLDLVARTQGVSLAELLGARAEGAWEVQVNATITAASPEECFARALKAAQDGFVCFKLKVGVGGVREDVARARAVRDAVGERAQLRLDANGAWSREQAHGALRAMRPMSLALLEQPVEASDLEGLAWLRERTDVKIAADEAVRSLEDVEALLDLGAVDTLVLKPMAIGGLLRARAMQRRAAQAGVSTIYTTLLDGAIGRRAVTHLAAATDTLEGPCGLATGELFERDVVDTPARPVRGVLVLDERARGLGCEPSGWVFGDGARAPDEEGAAPIRIPLPLAHRATYMAGRDALVAGGVARSYEALYDMACALARALARAGIRPGDRVAVMAENSVELVALIHGLTLLGAPFVAVHPRSSAQEALALLERAQPALWVMDAPSAHRLSAHVGGAPCPRVSLAELARAPQEADVVLRQEVGLDEVCAVLFTSGTTGAPKMVALTWQNIVFSATGSAIQLGHMPTDRWLDVLPMCHVAGLSIVMRCAILGTSVVLHEGWDPARAARAIAAGEVTMVSLVSRMLWDVLDVMTREGLSAHPSFRLVLLGGGAIPEELLARALEVGVPVAPTYGMTEATSQIATASPYLPRAPRTVGAPLVWTQLEVRPGAPGEDAGEVAVRGPTVVRGYSRIARGRLETDALEDGWFFTGDWASRGDGEAWEGVEIVDRRMDVVVTGGENVYPAEVEAVLLQHEAVAEACVVGRSDQHWGQRVEAVCVAAEAVQDPEEQTDDVIERARTQLAGFKIPRRVHWWRELPKSTLGKVKRAQVRAKIESQGVDAT